MDLQDIDEAMKGKLEKFCGSVQNIEDLLATGLKEEVYESLELKDKVDYDLFIAYTLNTLFWLYLRTKGANPLKSQVKEELTRIRECMVKAKDAHERNTMRPKVDKAAAGRFIKHGIQYSDKEKGQKRKRENDDDA